MANISAFAAISAGDAVLASVVSGNFSKIEAAVNSNALNSDNYGQSTILSQHISTGAILSQHLSNSVVKSANISDLAVVEAKMNYASSDGGVRVVRIGESASDLPANGVIFSPMTQTYHIDSVSTMAITFTLSDGIYGNPSFTATPVVAGEPAFVAASTFSAPSESLTVTAIDSVSAVMVGTFSATQDETVTVHVGFFGAASA